MTQPSQLPPAEALSGPSPAAASPAPAPGSLWRDGTYRAVGFSQFGDVEVMLTVAHRRIVAVRLTRVTTYFPDSVIAALPAQVLTRQEANVDLVSGGTGSSLSFRAVPRVREREARPDRATLGAGRHARRHPPRPFEPDRHPSTPAC